MPFYTPCLTFVPPTRCSGPSPCAWAGCETLLFCRFGMFLPLLAARFLAISCASPSLAPVVSSVGSSSSSGSAVCASSAVWAWPSGRLGRMPVECRFLCLGHFGGVGGRALNNMLRATCLSMTSHNVRGPGSIKGFQPTVPFYGIT